MKKEKIKNPAEGLFDELPNLRGIFNHLDRRIRYYKTYKDTEETRDQTIRERDALLKTVQKLTSVDLKIIYYLYHINGFSRYNLVQALQKEYRAQCEREKLLPHDEEWQDPF
jgi:hypothetical protein